MADFDLGARKYRDAVKVLASLEGAGYPTRLAGGCVRDRLRGVVPSDFDVATAAKPDEVMRHCRAIGWRTVPTGIDHGTVTLVMPSGPVEVTTLRVDVATDGRRATVAFGNSFEEDAARRDFTINAMFEDSAGVIYDYFGGQEDLRNGVLRFVGDAAQRIREDYLRILRFFRFQARLGFHAAPGTLTAIRAEAAGLARVSQERITSELLQTLAAANAKVAVEGLCEAGIWVMVLPEIPAPKGVGGTLWQDLAGVVAQRRSLAVIGVLGLQLARLDSAAFTRLGERLRLKTTDTRALAFLPEALHRLGQEIHPFADVAGQLDFIDACESRWDAEALTAWLLPIVQALGDEWSVTRVAELVRAEERFGHLRRAKLPLDGARLMAELGLTPGPALGEALEELRRGFRNGAWSTADDGLRWLRQRTLPRA